jgi:hypothetical protein
VSRRGGRTERERDLALARRLLAWADEITAEMAAFRARRLPPASPATPEAGTFPALRRNSQ